MSISELPPHEPWALEEARETLAFPTKYDKERRASAWRVLARDRAYRLRVINDRRSSGTLIELDAWQMYLLEDR